MTLSHSLPLGANCLRQVEANVRFISANLLLGLLYNLDLTKTEWFIAGAVLAEQHDEWAVARRYLGVEGLFKEEVVAQEADARKVIAIEAVA